MQIPCIKEMMMMMIITIIIITIMLGTVVPLDATKTYGEVEVQLSF